VSSRTSVTHASSRCRGLRKGIVIVRGLLFVAISTHTDQGKRNTFLLLKKLYAHGPASVLQLKGKQAARLPSNLKCHPTLNFHHKRKHHKHLNDHNHYHRDHGVLRRGQFCRHRLCLCI